MKQYVRLSFAGIDPDEVTQRLGIEPTQAHKSGDERGPGLTWRQSYWELTPEVDEGEFAADAHFRELLKVIEPRFAAIRALRMG